MIGFRLLLVLYLHATRLLATGQATRTTTTAIPDRLECAVGLEMHAEQTVQGTTADGRVIMTTVNRCRKCRKGTMGTPDRGCVPCPPGSIAAATGSITCTPCPPGTATNEKQSKCKTDSSSSPGTTTTPPLPQSPPGMRACSPGWTLENMFHNTWTCTPCPEGTYSPDGRSVCTPCPAQTVAPAAGSMGCSLCPESTVPDSLRRTCVTNVVLEEEDSTPATSPSGSSSSSDSEDDAARSSCAPGHEPEGRWDPALWRWTTVCVPCPAGQMSATGQTCVRCLGNRIANREGRAACTKCPAGTTADKDHQQCEPNEAREDTACDPGSQVAQVASDGALGCQPCPTGHFSSAATGSICVQCPGPTIAAWPGSTECLPCPPYTQPNPEQTECREIPGIPNPTQCPPGQGWELMGGQWVCRPCGTGSFNPDGRASCMPCPDNTVSRSAGSTTCAFCPQYTVPDAMKTTCVPVDNIADADQTPPPATASPTSERMPDSCAPGEEPQTRWDPVLVTWGKVCTKCVRGKASSTGESCERCEGDTVATVEGMAACTPCPVGTRADSSQRECLLEVAEDEDEDTLYPTESPSSMPIDDPDTVMCSPGSEQRTSANGVTECRRCSKGHYSRFGDSCELCPGNNIAPFSGSTTCTPCPPNTEANNRKRSCLPVATTTTTTTTITTSPDLQNRCEAGSEVAQVTSDGALGCQPCSTGHFSDQGVRCERCPDRMIAAWKGSTECSPCPPFTRSNEDQTACLEIPGITNPTQCQPGQGWELSNSQWACKACSKGSFNPDGKSLCQPCPDYTVAIGEGSTACTFCPESTVPSSQRSTCEPEGVEEAPITMNPSSERITTEVTCAQGQEPQIRWDPVQLAWTTVCSKCLRGKVSTTGESCERCEGNSVAPFEGMSACTACPAGTRADGSQQECLVEPQPNPNDIQCNPGSERTTVDGVPTCKKCPIGFFSPADGTACEMCEGNTIAPFRGSSFCTPCPVNTIANDRKRKCLPAAITTSAPTMSPIATAAPTSRARCAAGFQMVQVTDDGALGCQACPVGFFSPQGWTCLQCPESTIAAEQGSRECQVCPPLTQPNDLQSQCLALPGIPTPSPTTPRPTATPTVPNRAAQCEPGSRVVVKGEGEWECETCRRGQISTAGLTCERCPANMIAPERGSTECQPCPPNTQPNNRQGKCLPITPGSPTLPPTRSPTAAPTPAEQRGSTCNPGFDMKEKNGVLKCRLCDKGHFSASGGPCALCEGNTVAPARGATACVPCPLNTVANARKNHCSATPVDTSRETPIIEPTNSNRICPPGSEVLSDRGICQECGQGYFSPDGDQCIPCVQNTIAPTRGAVDCTPCPPDTVANYKKRKCLPIVPIREDPAQSPVDPSMCSPGSEKITSNGVSRCQMCGLGKFSSFGDTCAPCPEKSIAPTTGTSFCTACPVGTFADYGRQSCIQEGNQIPSAAPSIAPALSPSGKQRFPTQMPTPFPTLPDGRIVLRPSPKPPASNTPMPTRPDGTIVLRPTQPRQPPSPAPTMKPTPFPTRPDGTIVMRPTLPTTPSTAPTPPPVSVPTPQPSQGPSPFPFSNREPNPTPPPTWRPTLPPPAPINNPTNTFAQPEQQSSGVHQHAFEMSMVAGTLVFLFLSM